MEDTADRTPSASKYPTRRISVLIADDHTAVRDGLRALLEAESDIEVVGEAENGRRVVELVKQVAPAVVIMDIAMPLLNGLEATRQIRRSVPETRVLIFSMHRDDEYVQEVLQAGASGYVVKQTVAHELLAGIRAVSRGQPYLSALLAQSPPQRKKGD
ncbi:MAG: response regulator [Vicinamibacteria bacterium]